MSVEENKALIRRMYDLAARKEPYYDLLAPDFVMHSTDGDMSLEDNKRFDAILYAAFPEATITLRNIIAEGVKVAFQANIKMTHTGPFMGITPTGKELEMTNTYIVKITDNKIAEWWGTSEFSRVMQQLGTIPSGPPT